MALPLRVCLFSQLSPDDEPFAAPFERAKDLTVVAECSTWQSLQQLLSCSRVDVAIVNLDGGPDEDSPYIVERITEVAPKCAILGVSQNTHPDTIIAAVRAGCNQFVRWPIDPADLRSALDRIRQTRLPAAVGCQRICVIGASGGAGATTVACNLTMELAAVSEHRCALIDMNLEFGDVACSFDIAPRYTVAHVCRSDTELDLDLLEKAIEDLPCQVSILARPQEVGAVGDVTPDGVEQMFRLLAQKFPFVVVDLPRHFSPVAVATLKSADHVLIVSQLTVPHLRNAIRIHKHLLDLGANIEHLDLVLNRSPAHWERIRPDEAEKHFGRPVFAIIPNDYKRMGAARDLGHPIATDASNSPAGTAIHEMATRLANEPLLEERPRSGGLLGMFRKRRGKAPQAT